MDLAMVVIEPGGKSPSPDILTSLRDYLHKHLPHWNDYSKTFALPIFPDRRFIGPLNRASGSLAYFSGSESSLENQRKHKSGDDAEIEVFRRLKNAGETNGLGLRIFANLKVSQSTMQMLMTAMAKTENPIDRDLFKKTDDELADILVISGGSITLIEVKTCLNNVERAREQLEKSEKFLHAVLGVVGCTNLTVKKLLIVTTETTAEVRSYAGNCIPLILGSDNLDVNLLAEFFAEAKMIDDNVRSQLTLAFVMLSVGKIPRRNIETSLDKVLLEGVKGAEQSDRIIQQQFLRSNYKKQGANSSDYGLIIDVKSNSAMKSVQSEIFFLTPEQSAIMSNDAITRRIIYGPAGSGKTLLIQIKAVELLEAGQRVLIIVPQSLRILYRRFFSRKIGDEQNCDQLCISHFESPEKISEIQRFSLDRQFNLFIDEYFVVMTSINDGDEDSLNDLLALSLLRLCWIAVDPLQPGVERDFSPRSQIHGMETAVVSPILTVQRCSSNIYEYWKIHCGPFISLGHFIEGTDVVCSTVVSVNDHSETIEKVTDEVRIHVNQALDSHWKCQDMVILFDQSNLPDGFRYSRDFKRSLESKLPIRSFGKRDKFDGESIEFVFFDRNSFEAVNSFEWRIVITVKAATAYDEYMDYIIRSRAIFKLVIIEIDTTSYSSPENWRKKEESLQIRIGGDAIMLRRLNRQLYTAYYNLTTCEHFLSIKPDLVSDDEIREVIISPIRLISEAAIVFVDTHLLMVIGEIVELCDGKTGSTDCRHAVDDLMKELGILKQASFNPADLPATISLYKIVYAKLKDYCDQCLALYPSPALDSGQAVKFNHRLWTRNLHLAVGAKQFFENMLEKHVFWSENAQQLIEQIGESRPELAEELCNIRATLKKNLRYLMILPRQIQVSRDFDYFQEICAGWIFGAIYLITTSLKA